MNTKQHSQRGYKLAMLLIVLLALYSLLPLLADGGCTSEKCNSYVYLRKAPDPEKETASFNIAVLAAGGIRSFAFNERSWRRYIIDPWSSSNLHLFAHVTVSHRKCEIYQKGLDAIMKLATEVEVSHSQAPLMSLVDVRTIYGKVKSCLDMYSGNQEAGNILDMYLRRNRAFDMAMHYSQTHKFRWHIMMLVRLDSAFYAPKLEFYKIYKGLRNHTAVAGRRALIIPPACSFGHVCDRSVIGLPEDMRVYFNASMVKEVIAWSHANKTLDLLHEKHLVINDYECTSEIFLQIWLEAIHQFEITDTKPSALSFVTLRSRYADLYCGSSREQYFKSQLRHNRWVDMTTLWWNPVSGFDKASDPWERCGSVYSLNATEMCLRPECHCGAKG